MRARMVASRPRTTSDRGSAVESTRTASSAALSGATARLASSWSRLVCSVQHLVQRALRSPLEEFLEAATRAYHRRGLQEELRVGVRETPPCRCPGPPGWRPWGASSARRRCSCSRPSRTTGRLLTADAAIDSAGLANVLRHVPSVEKDVVLALHHPERNVETAEERSQARVVVEGDALRRGLQRDAPVDGPGVHQREAQPPCQKARDGAFAGARRPVDGDDEGPPAHPRSTPRRACSMRSFQSGSPTEMRRACGKP